MDRRSAALLHVVALAAYDDMDVGIIGVPVVDPNPIELGAEIPLGLRHQVAGERLQVRELVRILWGHDEAEMMAIPFAARRECAVVGVVVLGVEQAAGGAVLRHALPPQVGQVSAESRSPRSLAHDAGLDGDAARPVRHQPSGRDAGRSAAPEGGAPDAPSGSAVEAARLLGCRERLRDERLGVTGAAPVADAPDADAEIIVARHDASAREVDVIARFQMGVRMCRLSCAVAPRAKRLMCLPSSTARPRRTSRLLSCPLNWAAFRRLSHDDFLHPITYPSLIIFDPRCSRLRNLALTRHALFRALRLVGTSEAHDRIGFAGHHSQALLIGRLSVGFLMTIFSIRLLIQA